MERKGGWKETSQCLRRHRDNRTTIDTVGAVDGGIRGRER